MGVVWRRLVHMCVCVEWSVCCASWCALRGAWLACSVQQACSKQGACMRVPGLQAGATQQHRISSCY